MSMQVVKIESLSPTGHGIADNGWYVLGVFPNETVRVQAYKNALGITYAEILEIIEPSPNRTYIPTTTPFFDPNAPWQHLNIEQENSEKLQIVKNIFHEQDITVHSEINDRTSSKPLRENHYRNKTAYAFIKNNRDQLSFALFTRGIKQSGKIPQTENLLVHPAINTIGKQFLHFFNQKQVPLETLKYLTLRYSYFTNTIVAQILVTETNRKKLPWKKSDLVSFMNQHESLQGIIVSHSEPNIRSAIITKDFYTLGDIDITEQVLGKQYTYHPSQFFQIYPDAFAQILRDAESLIINIPNHNEYELLDLFSGVGIIGLHLSHLVKTVHGVEQSPLAKKYALQNAEQNNIQNFGFTEANVDQALDEIKSNQILIVDPARNGLTKQSNERIIEVQPIYILYISCNPETQARDIKQLQDYYDITWSRAYNLFPKTPHIEHVVFMQRKTN